MLKILELKTLIKVKEVSSESCIKRLRGDGGLYYSPKQRRWSGMYNVKLCGWIQFGWNEEIYKKDIFFVVKCHYENDLKTNVSYIV